MSTLQLVETDTTYSTRAANDKSASFVSIVNAMKDTDSLYYAELPSSIVSTSSDGAVSFADHFQVAFSNMGGTLTLTFRRSEDTNLWFVDESFVKGSVTVFEANVRLLFNVVYHPNSAYYSFAFLVKNVPVAPVSPSAVITVPDPSDYAGGKDDPAYIAAYAAYLSNGVAWSEYFAENAVFASRMMSALSSSVLVFVAHGDL